MTEPHRITTEHAAQMAEWIATRGGLAIWRSINLSNPGASWTTPVRHADGTPATKPTWQAANTPERIITDPAEVLVDEPTEVRRFRVAVRHGDGFSFKLTDFASRKVREAVEKAGEHAWYVFDYSTQEAVILVPGRTVPLAEWK